MNKYYRVSVCLSLRLTTFIIDENYSSSLFDICLLTSIKQQEKAEDQCGETGDLKC